MYWKLKIVKIISERHFAYQFINVMLWKNDEYDKEYIFKMLFPIIRIIYQILYVVIEIVRQS